MQDKIEAVYNKRDQFDEQDAEMITLIKEQWYQDKSVLTGLHYAYINMLFEHIH